MTSPDTNDMATIRGVFGGIEELVADFIEIAPEIPEQVAAFRAEMERAYQVVSDAWDKVDY